MAAGTLTIDELQVIISAQTKGFSSELQKVNNDLNSFGDKIKKGFESNLTTAGKVAVTSVIAGVGLMGKSFIESASQLQSLRASFESLTGSAALTDQVMRSMYQFGKQTAFTNEQIQAAARSFLAIGTPVDELGTMMQEVGDIAGATGADLGQLTLPLTQALARGKLQTQDFYQILNSGAGAFRITLQKVLDKHGLGGLQDALAAGTVSADILKEALADATAKGSFAFEGAIKQAQTFNGRMSNLKEAITQVGLSIIGVDAATGQIDPSGVFARLSAAVLAATNFLTAHGEVIKQVGLVISIFLVPAIISMGIQGLIAGGRLAAGILLALGPIGLVIAAVAAAAALIIMNWDAIKSGVQAVWGWIKDNWPLLLTILTGPIGLAVIAVVRYWDTIKNAAAAVFDWIKQNWPLLLVIITGPVGLAVYAVIKNLDTIRQGFANALNAVKNIWSGIASWFGGIVSSILGAFSSIPGRIKGYFVDGYNAIKNINWVQLGADIVAGIARGLNPTVVTNKMKSIASSAVGTVKSFLGIHSPSRVMRDQVGKMMGLGMAEGIDSSTKDAVKSAAGSAKRVLGAYGGSITSNIPTPAQLSSKLDLSLNASIPSVNTRQIPVNINLDGQRLLSFVIDGINNKSFMSNSTILDF